MVAFPVLPVELWLAILRWATVSRATLPLCTTTYHPFQADASCSVDQEAIAVKRTLVRVCKQWQRIVVGLLFEDIVIQPDASELTRAFQADDQEGQRFGRVRRACFPYYSCTSHRARRPEAADVLCLCTELEVLVRPPPPWMDDLTFKFPAHHCPPLLSLKRLDWWFDHDATMSGGINSLADVVKAAPNLEYLSLSGELCLSGLQQEHAPMLLPSVTTLCIRRINVLLLLQLHKWRLLSLQHVIVDTNYHDILRDFWTAFGGQLKTVEIGKTIKIHAVDAIREVLTQCPNLEELNYHIQFSPVPCYPEQRHLKLSTVRLDAAQNPFFADESNGLWGHLESHISALCSPNFPALKRVVFHGEWRRLREDGRFGALTEKLRGAGREIKAGQC